MPKVKAVIEYNGSAFEGFQRQKHTYQTVTGALEKALQTLNIDTTVTGSGRTDAGVHASNQIIDFSIPSYWQDTAKLKYALNRLLKDIRCKHITLVDDNFHARFFAKRRIYRYVFKTQMCSVFEKDIIAHFPKSFSKERLQIALKAFEGEHDFSLLCKSGSITHTNIRRIYKATYKKRKGYHFIYFEANGFLRAQVRMMIHLAMAYAQESIRLEELKGQINNQAKISTKLAPPQGLYLARVIY